MNYANLKPTYRPFTPNDYKPFYVDPEGRRILNCHSRGDRRFSALVARLKCGLTLEDAYQGTKLDANKKPLPIVPGAEKDARKGKDYEYHTLAHLGLGDQVWPYSAKHEVCYLLWYTYLCENEPWYALACEFDGYTDFFDGYGGQVYFQNEPIIECPAHIRACQARAIQWAVNGRHVHPKLLPMMEAYKLKYW